MTGLEKTFTFTGKLMPAERAGFLPVEVAARYADRAQHTLGELARTPFRSQSTGVWICAACKRGECIKCTSRRCHHEHKIL